jgi:Fic family protein
MKNFNAGTQKQQYEYKSFSPSFINTMPFDWKSDKTVQMLIDANRYLGELNASSEFVPDINFFIEMHIIKEATTSSRIEGTKTEIDEAVQPESNISREKRDDWQEVQNYIQAMNKSIKELEKLPLSMRLIKKSHKTLLSGVRGHGKAPGEFRKSQNWIGGANLKTASFIPPSHEELPDLLSDLEKFWHRKDIPELIRIAIAHYQFETIHPFLDGNGRTGRMIMTLHLVDLGVLSRPTLYLSDFFEKHRQSYFDALTEARRNNNLEHWIQLFLEGVIQTSKKGKQTFEKIVKLRQQYEKKILVFGKKAPIYQKLIYRLFKNPVVSPREVEKFLEVAPYTSNKILRELENLGILIETSQSQRNRSYSLHDYIQLFKD